jgi:hypothetical protein
MTVLRAVVAMSEASVSEIKRIDVLLRHRRTRRFVIA